MLPIENHLAKLCRIDPSRCVHIKNGSGHSKRSSERREQEFQNPKTSPPQITQVFAPLSPSKKTKLYRVTSPNIELRIDPAHYISLPEIGEYTNQEFLLTKKVTFRLKILITR